MSAAPAAPAAPNLSPSEAGGPAPSEAGPRLRRPRRPWLVPARMARAAAMIADVARRAHRLDGDDFLGRSTLIQEASLRFLRIHDIELDVRGSMPPGPKVIVMNHLGYIDPFLLGELTPYLPIAKSEVAAWPVVGSLGRASGVLFIVRGDAYSGFRVLRRARRALLQGATVLNFAEGTTSFGDDVLPFKRGLFGIARRTGVPVVPVALRFEQRALAWVGDDPFVPHYLDFLSWPRTRVRLDVLEPIDPSAHASADALADSARHVLRASLLG